MINALQMWYQLWRTQELRVLRQRTQQPRSVYIIFVLLCAFIVMMSACSLPGQQRTVQVDPRLKAFRVLSSRLITLDTQAEVDGTIQNTGHQQFPFDVSMTAVFYDFSGNAIGQAQGVAEDVGPGMTGSFVLIGHVDSTKYSRMAITLVSLKERRIEKNLPTPPPAVP